MLVTLLIKLRKPTSVLQAIAAVVFLQGCATSGNPFGLLWAKNGATAAEKKDQQDYCFNTIPPGWKFLPLMGPFAMEDEYKKCMYEKGWRLAPSK